MNFEQVVKKFSKFSPINTQEMMSLYYIENGRAWDYHNESCWGDFLADNCCPDYVNIPCDTEMDDDMLEWALSTPLLSACVMNPDVTSVHKYGWVLKTDGLWSRWYTAGLFCRSFTEQLSEHNGYLEYIDRHKPLVEGLPISFKYWWYILLQRGQDVPHLLTPRHGSFHTCVTTMNYEQMFHMPEAELKESEDKEKNFYTKKNEVHSSNYLYSVDNNLNSRIKKLTGDTYKGAYTSLNNTTVYNCTFEEVRDAMYEIYEEVV